MRISDGSSDVCSSDLPEVPQRQEAAMRLHVGVDLPRDFAGIEDLGAALGDAPQRPRHVRIADDGDRPLEAASVVEIEEAAGFAEGQLVRDELGREWCRESVGRYV